MPPSPESLEDFHEPSAHIICADGMSDDDIVAFLEESGDY